MADSTLAFDILARDHASSAFDKVARSADKTAAALKKTAKISDDVAKAETRLSKARDGEADAMGRVRIAEQRLQELRDKGLEGTLRFSTAEEQLSTARRKAAQASNTAKTAEDSLGKARAALAKNAETIGKDAGGHFGKGFGDGIDKEGSRSGKRFGGSLKKWFTGEGTSVFTNLGQLGSNLFGNGLVSGILKTPVLGPAIAGALGAAVATAAPAVGAIAAGGIVTGFGAGIAALGVVFAAKSKVVQDKWRSVMSQLGADMKLLSAPFESTLIDIANVFKRTVDKFNPALASAFQKMSVPISNFVDQAGRAFEKLIPAIGPITDAFNGILKATGPALQDAIGSLSNGMIKLANSVSKNPTAIADTVRGIGDLSGQLLGMVTTLNEANTSFQRLTGGTSLVKVTFEGIKVAVAGLLGPIILLAKGITSVSDAVNALQHSTAASGQSMSDAANKTVLLAQGMKAAGDGAVHAGTALAQSAHETHAANAAAALLAGTYDRQAAATDKLVQSLFRLQNGYLNLAGAQVSYQAAADAGTAAAKENGRTLDINTAKGRANKQALIDLAQSANAQTESMLRNNKGSVAAAASAEKTRANFVKLAMQMGATKPQAVAMAKSMIAIPNVTREAKLKANKADLDTKLATAKKQLADPKLTATKKAKLEATIAQLLAQKAAAQRAIDALHGKTVNVNVVTRYSSTGVNLTNPSSVGRRAAGGPVKKGMPYIVGEHRPELFVPKQDGEIVPRVPSKSKGAAFGGSAASSVSVSLRVESGGSRMDDFLVEMFRKYVRVNGGNVQAVLGR